MKIKAKDLKTPKFGHVYRKSEWRVIHGCDGRIRTPSISLYARNQWGEMEYIGDLEWQESERSEYGWYALRISLKGNRLDMAQPLLNAIKKASGEWRDVRKVRSILRTLKSKRMITGKKYLSLVPYEYRSVVDDYETAKDLVA